MKKIVLCILLLPCFLCGLYCQETIFAAKLNVRTMNRLIAYIFILLLIGGCNNPEKYTDVLDQAYELIDSDPDSAVVLLDMIELSENIPSSVKADYGYLKSLAHNESGKAMTEDSLILFTLDYYKNHNNTGRLSRTYQLAVSYYYWTGHETAMMETAQEGLQYNIGINDSSEIANSYDILAQISEEYGKDHKNAIRYLLASSRYDTKEQYDKDYRIGLCYAWTGPSDSSAYFIERSINSALLQGDTTAASHYLRNQADIFYHQKKYAESFSLMKKLKDINPALVASSYLTFADLFLVMHQLDSAQVYLDMAAKAKSPDNYQIAIDNRIMAQQAVIDYSQGRLINWTRIGQYNDSLWVDNLKKTALIEEKTNARNLLEQKNLKLTIDRQRILLALISVSLLAILLIFIFILYNRKKKEKIEVLQSMLKEAMHSNNSNKDDYFFKKILLQQLGLVRLIATTPTSQNQALLKQMSTIANKDIPVDEMLNWNDLYQTIDSIYNHFHTRLLQGYGNILNDREIQLCCLLCAEFSTKEISVVTQQSVRTIYQRKTTIRQKLKMDEKDDIVIFINNHK